jgi:hypothetical protein
MLLGIDHIVIAVRDPDAAAERITAEVGLAADGGGRHPGRGTFNRLIWLGDSYLELMGIDDPVLARGRGIGAGALALLERGEEGVSSFAIATDDIAADVRALRRHGSPYADPTPGERQRPDGEVVRWQTALPDVSGENGLPFLIEHRYEGAEWGAEARDARAQLVHPFGGKAVLGRLELAASDPGGAARRHHQAVGLAVLSDDDGTPDLPIGPQLLRFVPRVPGEPAATIAIDGTDGQPRSVDLLGCRFLLEVAGIGSS